jgi:hypothetical protein
MIKLSGKIRHIFEIDSFTSAEGKNFDKRAFWLEDTATTYPNVWQLELWNKDCPMIDSYNVGDFVTAYIDIKGKHWRSKNGEGKEGVMNTLKCWNIEKEGKPYKEIVKE